MCQHPGKWLFTGERTQPWPGRRWKEEETTLNTGKDGAPGAHPGKLPVAIPGAGRALWGPWLPWLRG